ncbi:uncharacterized protein BCR38DRAFT_329056 [Pseudomassariella vexata]|uniref:Wings apart-like protein C-terminal domain-containing protein n=1 Tax=Pseudomassariella vexata TaxID=1141098 RepID=A0A1Y2EL74_9PEZI|nr:uncharacterized protein BCR38DRAFT_329056 [Pseudomassariella vexata]ORY72034.1 hypothetical protein BCR38DRAFT_329056 [Pseudomassariella vexata]
MEAFDRLPNTVGQQPQIQQIVVRLAPKRQPNPKSPDSYEIPPDSPLRSVREARGRPVTLASKASNKPRLVDRLKQQAEEHDEPTGSEKSDSQVSWGEPVVLSQTSETSAVASPASPQSPGARRLQKSTKTRTTFARSTSGLKRVYGQDRITLLEEEDPYAAIGMAEDLPPVSKGRSLELVTHKAKSSLNLEDDPVESGSPGKARIRDIHELRQAGANSRAADEMHDFSIQIGSPGSKPSSSRRAALLQISDKVREKEFRRLLRDHGVDAMVLKDAGKESDIISGYLIAAILVHLLATSPSAHIARLLRAEEVGSLFGRLLGVDHDMKKIARERKTNLSKRSQASLAAIQTALMELPIWNASKPTNVSPRKVTLACLNLLVAEDVTLAGDLAIFPSSVTDQLFTFLSVARNDDFWDSTDVSSEGFDARYAGSVLELHALKSMESQVDSDKWMTDYIPTVADAFGATLQKPAASNSKLEHSLLKLVVDMTNFNPNALEVFVSRNILPALARSVCGSFAQALALVLEDEWTSEVSDRLVLKLAALINFVEQSMPARRAFYESHSESNSPMRELIRIFLDNHRALAEADSEAKGHLNVAFGYLSVFLGYLSLYPPVRQVFRSSHRAKNLRPMLDSIQEFTNVHRTAGVHAGYAERLQDLVDKLENDSTYD